MFLNPGATTAIDERSSNDSAARLDRAAVEILQLIGPVRFQLARTDAERYESFRLRYEAIIDQGWERLESFPEGIEREELDDQAVHIIGWRGDQPVASCRLVLPVSGALLPVERDFGIRVEPFGQAVEVDRMCISRHAETHRGLSSLALLSAAWQEVRRAGYAASTGRVSRPMLRLYRGLGVEHEILGPARVFWNEERFPIRFTAGSATERFFERVRRLSG